MSSYTTNAAVTTGGAWVGTYVRPVNAVGVQYTPPAEVFDCTVSWKTKKSDKKRILCSEPEQKAAPIRTMTIPNRNMNEPTTRTI